MTASLTFNDFRLARGRIARHVHETPLVTCRTLDELAGRRLYLKCENLQKCGAFKARGAVNTVMQLTDEQAERGVVTHSSGNHGQALAYAASVRGVSATVVVPANAPEVKVAAMRAYGAQIVFCEPTLDSRQSTAAQIVEQTGAELIHPYDDYRIIVGQGTVALELLVQAGDLDAIIVPVGGGGLLSGTAVAVKSLRPAVRVIGAEPQQVDDAYRSWKSGQLQGNETSDTIADGLRTTLGALTFPIIREFVDDIITVSEQAIVDAMRLLWERAKLVVEPSGAVPLAAALQQPDRIQGDRVGLILSGGNVDLSRLPFAS